MPKGYHDVEEFYQSYGVDFSYIMWNEEDSTKKPTVEDIEYINDAVIKAVESRGLLCIGGSKVIKTD